MEVLELAAICAMCFLIGLTVGFGAMRQKPGRNPKEPKKKYTYFKFGSAMSINEERELHRSKSIRGIAYLIYVFSNANQIVIEEDLNTPLSAKIYTALGDMGDHSDLEEAVRENIQAGVFVEFDHCLHEFEKVKRLAI